jgi:hypothetical protein
MEEKQTLCICIMAKTEICIDTTACLIRILHDNELSNKVRIDLRFCAGQSDLPKARSEQVTKWFNDAGKNDLFLFIDADQTFNKLDIIKSIDLCKNYDVVCGAYAKKSGGLTVQPFKTGLFYREKEGELRYGSTGFMMFSSTSIQKICKNYEPVMSSPNAKTYPLFLERVVDEPDINGKNYWLSEDYSFCWLVRNCGGKIYGYISPTIGHILTQEKFISFPSIYKWPEKSIVIHAGNTIEKWSPNSLNTGIGGSESAIIQLARYWRKNGYTVTVFCGCDSVGEHEGVVYKNSEDFNILDDFDILILWRKFEYINQIDIRARKCFIDLHDTISNEHVSKSVIDRVTKICVKSVFHRNMLDTIPDSKLAVIPNGGASTYSINEKRDPNYVIYASSYDRGLAYMLKWGWPKIKKACPNAYLKIFYGWDLYDKLNRTGENQLYKSIIVDLMKQERIIECGRISQEKLMIEKAKANIHWYTGDFTEIDCISVRESASLGCIPVVSESVEVFKEKIYCPFLIKGRPSSKSMQESAADKVIELIQNETLADETRKTIELAKKETWENTGEKWLELFD